MFTCFNLIFRLSRKSLTIRLMEITFDIFLFCIKKFEIIIPKTHKIIWFHPCYKINKKLISMNWENFLEMESDPELFVGTESKEMRTFCDKKIPKKLCSNGLKFLEEFEEQLTEFASDQSKTDEYKKKMLKGNNKTQMKQCIAFSNKDRRKEIVFIRGFEEVSTFNANYNYTSDSEDSDADTSFDFEYTIFMADNKYLCIGNRSGHSNILANEFIYNNSDGSSPAMVRGKEMTLPLIMEYSKKYYVNCCNDRWH